jgi:hypothetical protein
MNTINKIGKSINAFIWNHPTKTVFILGVVVGFILRSLF